MDNQTRTLNYLRFVDVDRMLYNFRANHRLSTNGAATNGGWDARTSRSAPMQGHFLTAWAYAYAVLGDTTCRDKANYMVAELAKCQANNGAAGFGTGYLSGFPESDFTALEAGRCPTATCPTTASTRPSPGCSTSGATPGTPRPVRCCWPSPAGSTPGRAD
ncbi:beta-L-arabinofuranosidase domain-containing protein [Micromonospora sp. M12]